MPTDSVELRKHEEKTCTDMRFLHQVFPTLHVFCSLCSFQHFFIPVFLQSVCFCMLNKLPHVPLGFQLQSHVLLCVTAVTGICFLYLCHRFWVDRLEAIR